MPNCSRRPALQKQYSIIVRDIGNFTAQRFCFVGDCDERLCRDANARRSPRPYHPATAGSGQLLPSTHSGSTAGPAEKFQMRLLIALLPYLCGEKKRELTTGVPLAQSVLSSLPTHECTGYASDTHQNSALPTEGSPRSRF